MKSISLKLFVLLGFVLLPPCLSYTQGIQNKNIQAGITSSFGFNFAKMGTSRLENNGVGTNFNVGLLMHKSFAGSKNFGFASGLEFDFNTINFKAVESIHYNYNDREIKRPTHGERASTLATIIQITGLHIGRREKNTIF